MIIYLIQYLNKLRNKYCFIDKERVIDIQIRLLIIKVLYIILNIYLFIYLLYNLLNYDSNFIFFKPLLSNFILLLYYYF